MFKQEMGLKVWVNYNENSTTQHYDSQRKITDHLGFEPGTLALLAPRSTN